MNKRIVSLLVLALVLVGLFAGYGGYPAAAQSPSILKFETMVGVPHAYIASSGNAIRGVSGGGLPWVIGSAEGKLSTTGELKINVRGLVFDPNDPDVIALDRAGKNTVPAFRAIVSCQSVDTSGAANVVNIMTGQFPATQGLASQGGGNADIKAQIDLPEPCIAPIIFVTSPTGLWFATTGM